MLPSAYALTNRQKDFCSYAGVFGVMICITCIVQHMMITRGHWLTYTLFAYYVFSAISFLVLALQKSMAPVLLIISSVLALVAEIVTLKAGLFSLIVLCMLLYHVIILIFLYMNEVPAALRAQAAAVQRENEEWAGKI